MLVSTNAIFAAFDTPLLLVDNEEERDRISRVIQASRPAVENAIYRVFAEALESVNEGLEGARIDIRLVEDGIDLEVVEEAESSTLESDLSSISGDVEKLTLRIIKPLKKAAADAAAEDGRSLNNWISSALARHLERRQRQGRREMRRAAREVRRATRGARRSGDAEADY